MKPISAMPKVKRAQRSPSLYSDVVYTSSSDFFSHGAGTSLFGKPKSGLFPDNKQPLSSIFFKELHLSESLNRKWHCIENFEFVNIINY